MKRANADNRSARESDFGAEPDFAEGDFSEKVAWTFSPLAQRIEDVIGRWGSVLNRLDWYVRLEEDIRRYILRRPMSEQDWRIRWAIYDYVVAELRANRVALACSGPDRGDRKESISCVVIHHSGTDPGVSSDRLSAMGLLRLYVPVHLDDSRNRLSYHTPIYSNHSRGGRQVFYAYHWLVRPDGQCERLLDDHRVGWHSGNRSVNNSSVGICLVGDHSTSPPTDAALSSLTGLIRTYAPNSVLTHSAVNTSTACPGPWASEGLNKWLSA